MKNIAITLLLVFSFAVSPVPALAQTDTGPTPGSFWYGVTTTFENVNLFFTFNNEKKAEKALTYAERRLAQAKSAAETENTGAVETALADYEAKLTLATESSKKVDDDASAKKLLTSIADNTAKHQETLSAVLEKVPEEARQAITKAIEASKRGQEEATKQITELKGEVEKLRQEIAELKTKDEEREQKIEELSKQKTESSVIQPKPKTVAPQAQTVPTQKTETTQSQIAPKTETPKTTTATFPNGAIVEMDANGNIVRTIKEAPEQTYTTPTQSDTTKTKPAISQNQNIQISIVSKEVTQREAIIEWTTSEKTESKLYISGGKLSSQPSLSQNGYSDRHLTRIYLLEPATAYSFTITATGNSGTTDYVGGFETKAPPPTIDLWSSIAFTNSEVEEKDRIRWNIGWEGKYVKSCIASGDWSGDKTPAGREEKVFLSNGLRVYTLTCTGFDGTNVSKTTKADIYLTPVFTMSINNDPSINQSATIGASIKLSWSITSSLNAECNASGDWTKYLGVGGNFGETKEILLDKIGLYKYTVGCTVIHTGYSISKTINMTVSE